MACAIHPDQPSVDTCVSCGHFMCVRCSEGMTQASCPTCRGAAESEALKGGPLAQLRAAPVGLGALCSAAWQAFQREPLTLSAAAFVTALVAGFAGIPQKVAETWGESVDQSRPLLSLVLFAASVVLAVLQQAVEGPMQMGQARMSADVLAARPVTGLSALFGQWRKLPRYLASFLLMATAMLVPLMAAALVLMVWAELAGYSASALLLAGGLALSPLALWCLLPLLMLTQVFAFEDGVGPLAALRRCYALAHHRRLLLLGAGAVSVAAMLVGFLTFCLGAIPAYAFVQMLWTATYLRLRDEVPAAAPSIEAVPTAPAGA